MKLLQFQLKKRTLIPVCNIIIGDCNSNIQICSQVEEQEEIMLWRPKRGSIKLPHIDLHDSTGLSVIADDVAGKSSQINQILEKPDTQIESKVTNKEAKGGENKESSQNNSKSVSIKGDSISKSTSPEVPDESHIKQNKCSSNQDKLCSTRTDDIGNT